eukprot:g28056.t1
MPERRIDADGGLYTYEEISSSRAIHHVEEQIPGLVQRRIARAFLLRQRSMAIHHGVGQCFKGCHNTERPWQRLLTRRCWCLTGRQLASQMPASLNPSIALTAIVQNGGEAAREAAEEHLNSWSFGSHQAIGCSEPRGAGTVVLAPDKAGPDWKQWSVRLARGYGIGRVPSR